MRTFLVFTIVLFSTAYSQSIQWGEAHPHEEGEGKQLLSLNDGSIYTVGEDDNHLLLRKYDMDLRKQFEKNFDPSSLQEKACASFFSVGSRLYMYWKEIDNRTDQEEIHCQTINQTTGQLEGDIISLGSRPIQKSKDCKGIIGEVESTDKHSKAVMVLVENEKQKGKLKKTSMKYVLNLFRKDNQLPIQQELSLEFAGNFAYTSIYGLVLDNAQNLHILIALRPMVYKLPSSYQLISLNAKGEVYRTFEWTCTGKTKEGKGNSSGISAPSSAPTRQFVFESSITILIKAGADNELLIAGISPEHGAYFLSRVKPQDKEMQMTFLKEPNLSRGKRKINRLKDAPDPELAKDLSGAFFKDFFFTAEGNTIFVSEARGILIMERSSRTEYKDIIIQKFDKDGTLTWTRRIKKYQTYLGASSFYLAEKGDSLYFFYNIIKGVLGTSRQLTLTSLDPDGNIQTDADMGKKDNINLFMYPYECISPSQGELLFVGKGDGTQRHRLGKLTF